MAEGYLLGIDIGTFESKGVLAAVDGRVVAVCTKPHDLIVPQPGWAEHDAERDWWGDFCHLSQELINSSGIEAGEILGIGCSTIGPCVLPLDGTKRPLRNAILYGIDTRASTEVECLRQAIGDDQVFQCTGNDLSAQATGPKILWIKNHEPEIFRRSAKFVPGSTYLVGKLTGRWVVDHYTASTYVPLYDSGQGCWSADLCEGIVSSGQLPKIDWTCSIAGKVSPEASAESGLLTGTPVIVGTVDAAAEALSVGVVKPGKMMLMYGSTAFMILPTEGPVSDRRLWSAPFLFPGTNALMAGMATTGTLTRWFKDNLAKDLVWKEQGSGRSAFETLAAEASQVDPGADGLLVLPYFSGERTPINDPLAKGAVYGLNLLHTRGHLYRAILESIGYGLRHHLDVFSEIGESVDVFRAVGGGVKNPLWLQIVSDICEVPQEVTQVSLGAAYGDAFLAGLGIGLFEDPQEIDRWVQVERIVPANSEHSPVYRDQYQRFRQFYELTRPLERSSD
ncbi:MAG: FGGY-family carbohydrate kinase [Acidobacteriota bacterium]|nr:MAG: FGGY-family carbohydrate kinase [Acidobacteriota bacterium]